MGKIRELTDQEVEKYRSSLLEIYGQYKLTPFVPGTYLNAYTDFIDVIAQKLANESVRTSITPHRLRKLLYYSNPALCTSDKLEAPSFGIDFIQELDRILEKYQTSASDIKPEEKLIVAYQKKTVRNKSVLILLLTLIPIAVLGYWLYTKVQKPYYFRDDFDNNSLEQLKNRGWEVMDFDSSLWFPQDSELNLMTSLGDYWTRGNDTPLIKNVVYHLIPEMDCFQLTTKFRMINNKNRFQQGGFFLLDKYLNRRNNIRLTAVTNKQFYYNDTIYNETFCLINNNEGDITIQLVPFQLLGDTSSHSIFFKMEKRMNNYKFSYKVKYDYHNYTYFEKDVTLDYIPSYIAYAAFNGYRIGDGLNAPLNNAPSIPVKFDWIKVEECSY